MESYYARRAAEYEKIYDKPERQADLARLRNDIPALFKGERVLEIACGTGYWTPLIAEQAESVLAVDYNEETLAIARTKTYPKGNVRFSVPTPMPCRTGGKVLRLLRRLLVVACPARQAGLVSEWAADRLEPGARVAFMDNRYVEGSSTAISRKDAQGNTYQRRRLADGSSHEVLKNFPTAPSCARAWAGSGPR